MADTRTPEQIAYDEELAKINAMPEDESKQKARIAFDSKYPTGRPVNFDESIGAAEALAFGITKDLIKLFPELGPIYDLFLKRKYTDAKLAYYQSDYYKNLTDTSAKRQQNQKLRPGVYAQEYDVWLQEQKKRLVGRGIKLTPTIEDMLEGLYLKGYSDTQVDMAILESGKLGAIGGSTLGTINQLKDTALDYGVNHLLGKSFWDKASEDLFAGRITLEDLEEEMKNMAMSAYPGYAKGIAAGKSFGLQTSALRQTMANLLEIDVDTIGTDNPLFKQLVTYVNPKTNTAEPVSLWDAEKIIKTDERWMTTKNAKETFDTLALKVLRDWGLA